MRTLEEEQLSAVFLLRKLREHLAVPDKYTDDMVKLNLLFLFAADEYRAIHWVQWLEDYFKITIPDQEVDTFFFSDVSVMQRTIEHHVKK